jgi:Predicted membrane protein
MEDPFNNTVLFRSDSLRVDDSRNLIGFSALEFIVKEHIKTTERAEIEYSSSQKGGYKPHLMDMIGNLFLMLKLANYRPLRFLIVGLIGVGVNEGLLAFLHGYLPVLVIISPISIESSILSNYFLNALWTFRERNKDAMRKTFSTWELIKYNLVALGGLAVNLIVLLILEYYGMEYLEANLVGILFGFILNYLGSEKIVWAHSDRKM